MAAHPTPAAEVDVSVELVRALLTEQHPDLSHLPVRQLASGWDNVLFRLGDDLVVRLPRRAVAVELVVHEQRWLPELAGQLPLPIPAPARTGVAGCGYPWPWSVCRFVDGTDGLDQAFSSPVAAAEVLAGFLDALHVPAPPDAPENPYRGVPLADRAESVEERLERMAAVVDAPALRAVWNDSVAAPVYAGPPRWIHGDLHLGNVVVHDGRLASIIDWGDVCCGDPATDLGAAWLLFPESPSARGRLREAYGADDALWRRARGNALTVALAVRATAADNPRYLAMADRTLAAVLTDR